MHTMDLMKAQVIADSVSTDGIRLTTMQLRYWRPIHSELMTHRVFSRNARSSRAVPVTVLLSEDIYLPHFMQNKRGMQSTDEVDDQLRLRWEQEWISLAQTTRDYVAKWGEEGMHKQWANRPLEWFGWIDVLVTSTDWQNFWDLRCHRDAQPDFKFLAELMRTAYEESLPKHLRLDEWHLPYITDEEIKTLPLEELQRVSSARCARLSYKPFDGNSTYEAELKRYDLLVGSAPVHASPTEHIATPDFKVTFEVGKSKIHGWANESSHGNFHGWRQFRKSIPNECGLDDYHFGT